MIVLEKLTRKEDEQMKKAPDDITVKKYFEETVPQEFNEMIKGSPIQDMEGTEFSVQFKVSGEGGGTYAIVVLNGKEVKVVPDGIPNPLIEIEISENDWRDSVTGKVEGIMEMFMSPQRTSRKYFNILKETSGTLNLSLTKDDGSLFVSKMRFSGKDSPTTTIKMKVSDYAAMGQGKLAGPTAFMSGKMKIEGDMGFAMKLGRFMGG